VTVDRPGARIKGYVNSTQEMSSAISGITNITSTKEFKIGDDGNGYDWQGKVDEVRILNGVLGQDWITTEYNNQEQPATFYSVGSEQHTHITEPWYGVWTYRQLIALDVTKISGTLTDFPVLITEANVKS